MVRGDGALASMIDMVLGDVTCTSEIVLSAIAGGLITLLVDLTGRRVGRRMRRRDEATRFAVSAFPLLEELSECHRVFRQAHIEGENAVKGYFEMKLAPCADHLVRAFETEANRLTAFDSAVIGACRDAIGPIRLLRAKHETIRGVLSLGSSDGVSMERAAYAEAMNHAVVSLRKAAEAVAKYCDSNAQRKLRNLTGN